MPLKKRGLHGLTSPLSASGHWIVAHQVRMQSTVAAKFSTHYSMVEKWPVYDAFTEKSSCIYSTTANSFVQNEIWPRPSSQNTFSTVGANFRCEPSCDALSSFGENWSSNTSGEKVLDKFDIEPISTRILLLKMDLIFKHAWQSRVEIVEQSELHLRTQLRRAELDNRFYT